MGPFDQAWLESQMLAPVLIGSVVFFLFGLAIGWMLWRSYRKRYLASREEMAALEARLVRAKAQPRLKSEPRTEGPSARDLARLGELERELADKTASQREAVLEVSKAKKAMSAFAANVEALRSERDELATRVEVLEAEVTARPESRSPELEEVEQARQETEGKLEQARQEAEEAAGRARTEGAEALDQARAEIAALKQTLSETESRNARLGIELQLVRTIRTEFEALRKDNQHLEEDLEQERTQHQQVMTDLRADIDRLENQIEPLQTALDEARSESERLQADLESLRSAPPPPVEKSDEHASPPSPPSNVQGDADRPAKSSQPLAFSGEPASHPPAVVSPVVQTSLLFDEPPSELAGSETDYAAMRAATEAFVAAATPMTAPIRDGEGTVADPVSPEPAAEAGNTMDEKTTNEAETAELTESANESSRTETAEATEIAEAAELAVAGEHAERARQSAAEEPAEAAPAGHVAARTENEIADSELPLRSGADAGLVEPAARKSTLDLDAEDNLEFDPDLGLVFTSRPVQVDDLTKIKGIGRVLQGRLHEVGVYRYKQIALWNDANVEAIGKRLAFKDRILRDRWREQCLDLHKAAYGEDLDLR